MDGLQIGIQPVLLINLLLKSLDTGQQGLPTNQDLLKIPKVFKLMKLTT